MTHRAYLIPPRAPVKATRMVTKKAEEMFRPMVAQPMAMPFLRGNQLVMMVLPPTNSTTFRRQTTQIRAMV